MHWQNGSKGQAAIFINGWPFTLIIERQGGGLMVYN